MSLHEHTWERRWRCEHVLVAVVTPDYLIPPRHDPLTWEPRFGWTVSGGGSLTCSLGRWLYRCPCGEVGHPIRKVSCPPTQSSSASS